jgi:AmmeMemoRadiSam system protein B
MARVRPAAVAGAFYPDDPTELAATVDTFLHTVAPGTTTPKAIVVPHAGYVYSGAIAARAYAELARGRGVVERVVLLGPAHRIPVPGLAVSSADALVTPLGRVRVDRAGRDRLRSLASVVVDDVAHAPEHSLEVQLPFIQRTLGDVSVLPILVGDASPATVAAVLDAVWGGPETALVVSTDLSHHLDLAEARRRDAVTAERIVAGEWRAIDPYDACGAAPLRGLLVAAERHGLHTRLLDLRTSGDTGGPADRVVGYGAFTLS